MFLDFLLARIGRKSRAVAPGGYALAVCLWPGIGTSLIQKSKVA